MPGRRLVCQGRDERRRATYQRARNVDCGRNADAGVCARGRGAVPPSEVKSPDEPTPTMGFNYVAMGSIISGLFGLISSIVFPGCFVCLIIERKREREWERRREGVRRREKAYLRVQGLCVRLVLVYRCVKDGKERERERRDEARKGEKRRR